MTAWWGSGRSRPTRASSASASSRARVKKHRSQFFRIPMPQTHSLASDSPSPPARHPGRCTTSGVLLGVEPLRQASSLNYAVLPDRRERADAGFSEEPVRLQAVRELERALGVRRERHDPRRARGGLRFGGDLPQQEVEEGVDPPAGRPLVAQVRSSPLRSESSSSQKPVQSPNETRAQSRHLSQQNERPRSHRAARQCMH